MPQMSACSVSMKQLEPFFSNGDQKLTEIKNDVVKNNPQLQTVQVSDYSLAQQDEEEPSQYLQICLVGSSSTVMLVRSHILRQTPIKHQAVIASFASDVIARQSQLHDTLSDIAVENNTTILVQCHSKPSIVINGSFDAVENTRLQVLLALDQQLGLTMTAINIPCYLQHLVAGRKHQAIQTFMEEAGVNVYLQSPFYKISDIHYTSIPIEQRMDPLYLTGSSDSVARIKETVRSIAEEKRKSFFQMDSTVKPLKLDWIMRYRQTQLIKIMRDNGSVIIFPALGSGCSTITVYAENRLRAERTLRLLNYLIYDIYEAVLVFGQPICDDSDGGGSLKGVFSSYSCVVSIIDQICSKSGVELMFYGCDKPQMKLIGHVNAIEQACRIVRLLPFVAHELITVQFLIELAAEQREFISGKKNGKINKIMKACDVVLYISTSNEYNIDVVIESCSITNAMDGLAMLQEELPAETSFYVPDAYHRRIIGVGGKNIQRVMKKYGAYVKFFGSDEYKDLGGYFENEHNVVARTPAKNKASLSQLENAIMDFIASDKDKYYTTQQFNVPLHLHTQLAYQHGFRITMREFYRKCGLQICWPERNGSDQVSLYGPRTQLPALVKYLQSKSTVEWQFAVSLQGENPASNIPGMLSPPLQAIATSTSAEAWGKKIAAQWQDLWPNVELLFVLYPESRSTSTSDRVQWSFTPFSSGLTVFRVRHNASLAIQPIRNHLRKMCKEDQLSLELEPEFDQATVPSATSTATCSSLTSSSPFLIPSNKDNMQPQSPFQSHGPKLRQDRTYIGSVSTLPLFILSTHEQLPLDQPRQLSFPRSEQNYQPLNYSSSPISSLFDSSVHPNSQAQGNPLICQPYSKCSLDKQSEIDQWSTPGCGRQSMSRSSCPDIFLAPDLFASSAIRRVSVTLPFKEFKNRGSGEHSL